MSKWAMSVYPVLEHPTATECFNVTQIRATPSRKKGHADSLHAIIMSFSSCLNRGFLRSMTG